MHNNCSKPHRDTVCLLTPEEMGRADRYAIDSGTPGRELMETAGQAVAAAAGDMIGAAASVCILAGPGNNGGDGFVAARYLAQRGHRVRVVLLGARDRLSGDAAWAGDGWKEPAEALSADTDLACDLVIDALFGAGLGRDLDGPVAALVEKLNAAKAGAQGDASPAPAVLAVDLPSGIDGRTGAVRGAAVRADRTVTFFRRKPGHLLMPGRAHCGQVDVRQIGIGEEALAPLGVQLWENRPVVWSAAAPDPAADGHKYDRGHAVVVSGPATRTGASRLAAGAALRTGAGLVTVASPPDALLVHAAHLTAVMMARADGAEGLAGLLADPRFNCGGGRTCKRGRGGDAGTGSGLSGQRRRRGRRCRRADELR